MSNNWQFFPCSMNDNTAFIFYDHGISETIDQIEAHRLLKVKIAIQQPSSDGLPADEELPALSNAEEAIQNFVESHSGYYVGRLTVAGARYFSAYVDLDDEAIEALLTTLENTHRYPASFVLQDDYEKDGYWRDLFPTEQDWRVMQDMKVIDNLSQNGDDLSVERLIDHWIMFESPDDLNRCSQWAQEEGFEVAGSHGPDDESPDHSLHLKHRGTPQLEDISHYSLLLMEKAKEFEGEYDGWGTTIEHD